MERLKELLGEELYNQVIEKVGDTPISIGEGKIPMDRFNEVNNKKKELEEKVDLLEADLRALKEDSDTLLSTKNELEEELKTTKLNNAIEATLTQTGAKNTKTIRALLDMSKVVENEEGIAGLEEQLSALKQSDPYLFSNNKVEGNSPNTSNLGGGGVTKKDFTKMSYKERLNLFNSDKDLYETLSK